MTFRPFHALLVLLAFAPGQVAAQGNKKPETSKAVDFEPTKLTKLAVLVVGNDRPSVLQSDQQRLVEDVFLESLLAKGHTIVARSDVASIFKEKQFQDSGATEKLATSVGKFLNVPAVLVVRITLDSAEQTPTSIIGKATIGARLLNVETGAIMWSGTHTVSTPIVSRTAISTVLYMTSAPLAESFPDKPRTGERAINPKTIPKLAIIMVSGATPRLGARGATDTDQQRLVEDAFIQVLLQKEYGLVSRTDLQSIAKEQRFQQSGLTEDNAVAVGKLLNVPAVLMVSITDFGADPVAGPAGRSSHIARASLAARLIDVGSGEVLWVHSDLGVMTGNMKGDETNVLNSTAKDVVNFFPAAPGTTKVLFAQAQRLEFLGQTTSAMNHYQYLIKNNADTVEGKKAAARVKILMAK